MVNLNFGGIIIPVETATESMLFSWMIFHSDVKAFRIDNFYFELVELTDSTATVKVKTLDSEEIVTINDRYNWKFSDNIIDGSIETLDYHNAGNYSAIMTNESIRIGVTEEDVDVSLSFNVDNHFDLSDVTISNRIYPEVKQLGFDDDGLFNYSITFKNWGSYRLFYDPANPLDSYVLEE